MPDLYVLHHDDSDGYASAAVIQYKYQDVPVTFIPVQYNQPFPKEVELNKDTTIYIVDFSYSRELLEDINSKVKRLVVIDHHDTAAKELEGLDYCVFDLNKSGAALTWSFFYPRVDVPEVIQLVQDRDLWHFRLANSKAFEAGIHSLGVSKNLMFWTSLLCDDMHLKTVIQNGKLLVQELESRVRSFINNPSKYKVIDALGYRVAVYNTTMDISEIAEGFYTSKELNIDYTISYFVTNEGVVVLNFRTNKDSGIHVGNIAKALGGGGHVCASGAPLSREDGIRFLEAVYG